MTATVLEPVRARTATSAPSPVSPVRQARRVPRLPSWPVELLLLGGLYVLYALVRLVVDADLGPATRHAESLLSFESATGLDMERWLNSSLNAVPVLAVLASYWYAVLHYTVTPAVLVWMRRRHPGRYVEARNVLAGSAILGVIGFWLFPTTPPRLLSGSGYGDTLAKFAEWGWWGGAASAPKGMAALTNELAAMPSLHVGWAVWVGWYVARHAQRSWVRRAAIAYPVITTLVVMATANHYLVDAVAGALVVAAAGFIVRARRSATPAST